MSQAPLITEQEVPVPAVGTAGNDLTTLVGRSPYAGVVNAVRFLSAGTQAGVATNSRKWQLVNKGQAGAGATVVAETDVLTRTSSADGSTTLGSTTVSSATAAFTLADVGKTITGTGIPALATIVSVTSGTVAVISAAATATAAASVAFTIAGSLTANVERDLGLSLTAANLVVAQGDVLALVSTHLGTGVVDPGGMLVLEFSRVG